MWAALEEAQADDMRIAISPEGTCLEDAALSFTTILAEVAASLA